MQMAKRIQLSSTTRKGIALGIGALCACAVGVLLAVGRSGDDTGHHRATRADAPRSGGVLERSSGSGDGLAQFRSCLEGQGVTLPERGRRALAPSDGLRAALEACRQYLPRPPVGDDARGLGPQQGSPPGDRRDDDSGAEGTF